MKYYLYRVLLFTLLTFYFLPSHSQNYIFSDNTGKDGLRLISSKQDKISLEFSIYEFQITNSVLNGEPINHIQYGLNLVPGEEGAPELPFIQKNILIPNGAQANLKINNIDQEVYSNIDIAPAAKIPFDSEEIILAQKGSKYQINSNYPVENIRIKQTEIRGMQFVQVAITPFQLNPVTKELTVSKNIQFEIEIEGGKGTYGDNRYRSPYWDPIIYDFTFNSSDIPKIDYTKRNLNTKDDGCEYLIIVPEDEDFLAWADTIRGFRSEQGIQTKVMTVSEIGGNDVSAINSFFENVYYNWDPVPSAVLLMSDYGESNQGITSITYPHPYEGSFITDNYYADVTNNNLPDFVFARMTANNNDELEILVTKLLNYERTPPTDENFYNEPITALGWQTERWFQICSETIGGYMSSVLNKNPNRINAIYGGDPNIDPWSTAGNTYAVLNYFGPSGLNYLPSSPSDLGGWSGGSPYDIINGINSGSFILQHRDHGNYGGWGEPAFNLSYINQLNNIDKLTHVFSINCQTGQFNVGDNCFAEKFHRHPNGGAVSLTAPTQVSYSFVNDALVWGIYDNMWPDFMPDYGGNQIPERDFRPAFGLASGKYFLASSNWASESMKTITYRLFHHHGDAFGNIYSEVPLENEVTHVSQITSDITSLTINAVDGSLVGLSVNGELLTSGFIEDGSVDLGFPVQEPGNLIKVVVTKQNYYRYEDLILVTPTAGPYVIKTDYSLNDENWNEEVDFNEEININVTVKNYGQDDAENVDLNLFIEDEFIEIINSTYNLGSISAGQEIEVTNAFTFRTDVYIPDQHLIDFIFTANNSELNWSSELLLNTHAPNLEYSVISFEEVNGNDNHYLDPGETALATFNISNTGSRSFPAGESVLFENSEYISIVNASQEFDEITPNSYIETEFEITSTESTPYSSIVSVFNQLEAAPFDIEKELSFSIGLIMESWESESIFDFHWENSGDQEWYLTDDYTVNGEYAMKSGNIGDNETSVLSVEYNVLSSNQVSFYAQISSDEDHDFLNFYIDDELIQSWSGLVLFEEFTFPVSEGNHLFSWEYTKDNNGHSGLDAAWIDYIIFPPGNIVTEISENYSNNQSFSLYPNPAINEINIDYNNNGKIYIEIYDSFGKLHGSEQIMHKVDIRDLKSGIYFIKLFDFDNNKFHVLKFSKI